MADSAALTVGLGSDVPLPPGAPQPKVAAGEALPLNEYVQSLFGLPKAAFILLLLEFLNSYRSWGLSNCQQDFMNNDYGMTDEEVGWLTGAEGTVKVIFGILGSFMTGDAAAATIGLHTSCIA